MKHQASSSTTVQPLSQQLREQTRAAHERVEQAIDRFGGQWTLQEYAKLLARWRAFHRYWDPTAARLAPPELRAFFAGRSRIRLVERDLADLSMSDVDVPPFSADQLPVRSIADLLGGCYVVEGSTLGGQVLCKRFAAVLPVRPDHGLRYFSGHGASTTVHWRETKQLLDDSRWREGHSEIIAAANRAFDALTDYFSTR